MNDGNACADSNQTLMFTWGSGFQSEIRMRTRVDFIPGSSKGFIKTKNFQIIRWTSKWNNNYNYRTTAFTENRCTRHWFCTLEKKNHFVWMDHLLNCEILHCHDDEWWVSSLFTASFQNLELGILHFCH